MKHQRRTIFLTAVIGLIIYGVCLLVLGLLGRQTQIDHLASLRQDYQAFRKATAQQYLTSWAQDHQLEVILDSKQPQTAIQRQAHDLLTQNTLGPTSVYRIQRVKGQKYLFYFLDTTAQNRARVMVKKYHPLSSQIGLISIFSLIYIFLWSGLLILQYRLYRRQRRYLQAITRKLQQIAAQEETDSLIVQDNTPYTKLIQAANAVDHQHRKSVTEKTLAEHRFAGLLKHLPVGVMLLDDAGNVLEHNQMMAQLLGVTIDSKKHPFVDDIQTYRLSRMIEHTLRKQKNHHRIIHLYGEAQRYVDANVIRIAHQAESIEHQVIVILYDLTPIQNIERQQAEFLSNISHELKTPVTAIMGFTDTLLQGTVQDPQQATKFLKIIQSESHRLLDLINDSLTLTTIDQTASILPEVVNVQDMAERIITERQGMITKLNLQTTVTMHGNPQVSSYPSLLEQILQNLLSNAIKYNQPQGQVTVALNHNEIENFLELTITDSGIGITPADQEHIFERFYRADKSRNQDIVGTGLGLAIVQAAVQSLNGELSLESKVNQGTRIRVQLPL
ncbi:PAS domain-containing protein [Lactobacillus sp. DCY120]|uniref:histidine kinase n=1 Tax=Bombilactobacillus apium TaxID=2675299 RepID=A0A850R393_9LACO|nr:PAS domain-containing sensor histidine kinase [Bombilactobacillus apium]NVY96830.1 PAS domain-containing protein [Bombilactobacillus apium]